jgi:hypothetical protein
MDGNDEDDDEEEMRETGRKKKQGASKQRDACDTSQLKREGDRIKQQATV